MSLRRYFDQDSGSDSDTERDKQPSGFAIKSRGNCEVRMLFTGKNLGESQQNTNLESFKKEQQTVNRSMEEKVSALEKQQDSLKKQQKDQTSRITVVETKIGDTSSKLRLVENNQEKFSKDLNKVIQRAEQHQSETNRLAERFARHEERQNISIDGQKSYNEAIINCTKTMDDKLGAATAKMEAVHIRAEGLLQNQEKIGSTIKQIEQTAEERQKEQHRYTQIMIERVARVDEKQNFFFTELKSYNEQMIARTDGLREKVGEISKQVEVECCRLDNLQKIEQELKDTSKRVFLLENYITDLRNEQKVTNELLKNIVSQMKEK